MRAVRRGSGIEPEKNALRVAIARAGVIEREWTLETGTVTLGRSPDADVAIAGHALDCATFVRIDDGAMTLAIPAGATGRIVLAGTTRDVAPLAGASVSLDAGARGRIVIGDVSLLFQRVAAPPKRTRPELPASVRGGLLDRVDWLFTALAAASFMAHLAVVVGLSNSDWPAPSMAELDRATVEVFYAEMPMPEIPQITDPTTPSETTAPTETDPTPSPSDPSPTQVAHTTHTHTTSSPVSDPDPSVAIDQVVDTAVQTLIGAHGLDGALADVLRGGGVTTDQADVLATVDAVAPVASADDHIGVRHGHTSGDPDFGPHTLGPRAGPLHEGDDIHETGPRPVSVTVQPIVDPVDPTIFDDAMLRRALRARMSAIQRCYETELTRTPGLAGRLDVSMQVERVGSLSHVEIADDTVGSRQLGECVVNQVRTIRLPTGPSAPVIVEYPIVFAPQS